MIGSGRRSTPGPSAKAPSLLMLLARDLPTHHLQLGPDGDGRFVPKAGGPVLEVSERVERRFLGRTEIARFRVRVPSGSREPAVLRVSHRGRLRREGVEVRALSGGAAAERLAGRLASDSGLATAVLPLDFTLFELRRDGEEWELTVELMGASRVSIALPPISSYVRLHADQREALLASIDVVTGLLGESE